MKSMVRIDDDLMQFVVGMANNNGVSIQRYLNNILEKGIIKSGTYNVASKPITKYDL